MPENLTFAPGQPLHVSTYSAHKRLLAKATQSIHLTSFYWTLLGTDTEVHDYSSFEVFCVVNLLLHLHNRSYFSLYCRSTSISKVYNGVVWPAQKLAAFTFSKYLVLKWVQIIQCQVNAVCIHQDKSETFKIYKETFKCSTC